MVWKLFGDVRGARRSLTKLVSKSRLSENAGSNGTEFILKPIEQGEKRSMFLFQWETFALFGGKGTAVRTIQRGHLKIEICT